LTGEELANTPLSGATTLSTELAVQEKPSKAPSKATQKKHAQLRAEDIRSRVETIADNFEALPVLIAEAFNDGDWQALGYESWETYVKAEFHTGIIRVNKAIRKAWVKELTAGGMTTREIAPVVNVDQSTVVRDLQPETEATIGGDGLVVLDIEDDDADASPELEPTVPGFNPYYQMVRKAIGEAPTYGFEDVQRAKLARFLFKTAKTLSPDLFK
jgi:hypothetical protein